MHARNAKAADNEANERMNTPKNERSHEMPDPCALARESEEKHCPIASPDAPAKNTMRTPQPKTMQARTNLET